MGHGTVQLNMANFVCSLGHLSNAYTVIYRPPHPVFIHLSLSRCPSLAAHRCYAEKHRCSLLMGIGVEPDPFGRYPLYFGTARPAILETADAGYGREIDRAHLDN